MKPYLSTGSGNLYLGDCKDVLPQLDLIDAIVTDPPYGLRFMGKKWDYSIPSVDEFKACLDVLKPGGHMLCFAGTRTQHRMGCNIEDAGFEIRDMIAWVYGSGFPKSMNIGKAIDKAAGDKGKSLFEGYGTALKPAFEPITVARKPIPGTVASNVLKYGTGGLNIDACRVETEENLNGGAYAKDGKKRDEMWGEDAGNSWRRDKGLEYQQPIGRYPANLIHDGSDEVVGLFPETGVSSGGRIGKKAISGVNIVPAGRYEAGNPGFGDSGSAARFFYCAKASRSDRGEGNTHPTVKPTKLMEYLVTLILPPGGTVLDPYGGSGTTGVVCERLGVKWVLIERDEKSCEIAAKRIEAEMDPFEGLDI